MGDEEKPRRIDAAKSGSRKRRALVSDLTSSSRKLTTAELSARAQDADTTIEGHAHHCDPDRVVGHRPDGTPITHGEIADKWDDIAAGKGEGDDSPPEPDDPATAVARTFRAEGGTLSVDFGVLREESRPAETSEPEQIEWRTLPDGSLHARLGPAEATIVLSESGGAKWTVAPVEGSEFELWDSDRVRSAREQARRIAEVRLREAAEFYAPDDSDPEEP